MTVRAVSAAALSTAARAREAATAMGTEVARLRAAHRTRVEERRAREATAGPWPVRARFDRSFLLTAEPALSARDGEVEGRAFRLDALDDHHPVRGMIGLILVIALIGTMLALALGGTAWGVYHLLNART